MSIDKARELQRAKSKAMACLAVAALAFISGLFIPPGTWWGVIKASAEAALVGGLADWFAVVALFRRPMGLPIPHTAVIPANKDRIADNLADFVKEKFLAPAALVDLIRRREPVQMLGAWLSVPDNARRLGRHAADLASHAMDLIDDRRIKAFMADAVRTVAGKVDLSKGLGATLRLLTRGGRHQQLLSDIILLAQQHLGREEVRSAIVERVVAWLKEEHAVLQKVLPSEWIGGRAADVTQTMLGELLKEMATKPEHEYRVKFDALLNGLITRLESDPDFLRRGEEIKQQVLANQDFLDYTQSLWADLRDWLSDDLAKSTNDSVLAGKVQQMGQWLGNKIHGDPELRQSLDEHLARFVRDLAPGLADHLVDHIRNTVRQWDAQDMATQLEQQIGPDLQFIRISGTAVGALIGAALFVVTHGLSQLGLLAH